MEVTPAGSGVPNADMIMYVAAAPEDPCGPTSGTIAFAGACYLEDELNRLVFYLLFIWLLKRKLVV